MKKAYIIISFVIIMGILGGCHVKEPIGSSGDSEVQGTETVAGDAKEWLTKVLNNESKFVAENGAEVDLKHYKIGEMKDIETVPKKYVIIDLDQDGTEELVLYVNPDFGAYLVFHVYEGTIYVFELTEREMIDLKQDGTFEQSEGAGINAYVKFSFENDKYVILEEAYANDYDNVYRLYGKESIKEDVKHYITEFEEKESISWMYISE